MVSSNPAHAKRGLDPKALMAIRDLELRARVVVEGLWAGLHRSPFSGFSVEFTEYRQYVPGDDPRYLDWKVLARSDREYVRKFEDETNMRCELLVDHSRSMRFASGDFTKADYARTLAASLAYFLLHQRDMVGLTLFADSLVARVPARWRQKHLRRILAALDRETEGTSTRLAEALDVAGRLWHRRSLVVLISDFLSPIQEWEMSIGHLVAAGHDVRAIQILDPAETTLEFGSVAEWEDLESGSRLYVDPDQARAAYSEKFERHQQSVRQAIEKRGVPLQTVTTDRPFDLVLLEWIRKSGNRDKRTARQPPVRHTPAP